MGTKANSSLAYFSLSALLLAYVGEHLRLDDTVLIVSNHAPGPEAISFDLGLKDPVRARVLHHSLNFGCTPSDREG